MTALIKWFLKFPTSRLSRRIGLWVFISVIVIEAIIFIPSYMNRKKELLAQIKNLAATEVALVLKITPQQMPDEALLLELTKLMAPQAIVGGTLYRPEGAAAGSFGEKPELLLSQVRSHQVLGRLNPDGSRYDLAFRVVRPSGEYHLIVRSDATRVRRDLFNFFLRISGLVIIISIFVTVGAWLTLGTLVVTPILRLRKDLVSAGDAISNDRPPPDFVSTSFNRRDELGDVIDAFWRMYRQITDAINRRKHAEEALQRSFHQVEAYSRVLDTELKKGRKIQHNFLPSELPHIPGWESAAYFKPARQVAGDFYDLFPLPGNAVGIVIADVCDKGVGAALFMALFRSLIRIFSEAAARKEWDRRERRAVSGNAAAGPAAAENTHLAALTSVALTNNYIAAHHGDLAMFATLFFGVLDPATGVLNYISGGHDPLPVVNPGGGVKTLLKATGPAVGVVPEMKFDIRQVCLSPGEFLVGYTDGVTEALGKNHEFYTFKQLLKLLETPKPSASELTEEIAASVSTHTASADQHDDITLLILRRLP
ncbi:MAG: PP2C family protein-serine/threonine phosphatase [Thermodesulfobacteriota bacterium]